MELPPIEMDICKEYSKRDETGRVHCSACPLVRESDVALVMCKRIGHYDKDLGTWVPDAWGKPNEKKQLEKM